MRRPRPICVHCRREMTIEENGYLVHIKQSGDLPYQIWAGDLWRCSLCGARVVTGWGAYPMAERHERREFERLRGQVKLEVSS